MMLRAGTKRRLIAARKTMAVVALLAAAVWTHAQPASARTPEETETSRSLIGGYLAGRFAKSQHDMAKAATF